MNISCNVRVIQWCLCTMSHTNYRVMPFTHFIIQAMCSYDYIQEEKFKLKVSLLKACISDMTYESWVSWQSAVSVERLAIGDVTTPLIGLLCRLLSSTRTRITRMPIFVVTASLYFFLLPFSSQWECIILCMLRIVILNDMSVICQPIQSLQCEQYWTARTRHTSCISFTTPVLLWVPIMEK